MLSTLISLFFAAAVVLSAAVIARSLVAARDAWERLAREGELLRAGIALQAAAAGEMRLRGGALPIPRRAFATRRPGCPAPMPLRACAA